MANKCSRCGKDIVGKIRVITYRKKLGSKSVVKVEMYDEKCFKLKNKESATKDECCKQKRKNKTRN